MLEMDGNFLEVKISLFAEINSHGKIKFKIYFPQKQYQNTNNAIYLFFQRESFCVEPPCGQLNPMVDDMYVVLRQIFEEYYDIFQFDSFHYGGDEVSTLLQLKLKYTHFFILFFYDKKLG